MLEHCYAVIMAGGGGTRLWPLSKKGSPKQMLKLFNQQTLFQIAVKRLDGVFDADHIFVVTVAEQAQELQDECPQIPKDNFLLEPQPRGTASVVGLAAAVLHGIDPLAKMAILTADHFIENVQLYKKALVNALVVAEAGYLVTLGIHPAFPSTGYGYIQRGEILEQFGDINVYRVKKFKEKPDLSSAEKMIIDGDHDWNSGMFIWRADRILEEFERLMPELFESLEQIKRTWNTSERYKDLEKIWNKIHPETIDYGIMENAHNVVMLPENGLGWNDVGSWDSLFDVLSQDGSGNIILGKNIILEGSSSSLIFSENNEKLVVGLGISDLIIVDTGKALLVCPRSQAQSIRDLVKQLKNDGYSQYL